jgi:hypothetical protein
MSDEAKRTDRVIPESVLKLLRERWKDADVFDDVFAERSGDPSGYHHRKDRPPADHGTSVLTTPEVAHLVADSVFGPWAKTKPDHFWINEHAEHALTAFLGKVYVAWDEYLRRIEAIPTNGSHT